MASALPGGGTVHTLEISDEKAMEARANFDKAGMTDRIVLTKGHALNILAGMEIPFDLIFLDANRSEYMGLKPHLVRLLNPGGLLVCDNAVSHETELWPFMEAFKKGGEFTTCIVPVGKGEFLAYKL